MANQLNDHQISPTNYMTAFLRQRGWRLPNSTITIPNVIPEVEPKAAAVSPSATMQARACMHQTKQREWTPFTEALRLPCGILPGGILVRSTCILAQPS